MDEKEKTDAENEEKRKDIARLWLMGQQIVKKDYKPEAFDKFWSEKHEQEREEETTKGNE